MKATPQSGNRAISCLLIIALLLSPVLSMPIFARTEAVTAELGITPEEFDKIALDPQSWRIQDTMTWDDWSDNPAVDYRNDNHNITVTRPLKGLLVLVDYYDRGFMVLDEVGSDPMGNPQVSVDSANGETAAEFWEKFLTIPGEWNNYTSIQDHWYDNAYGTWQVDVDVIGPYTMPFFEFQYGFYSQSIQSAATWPTIFPGSYSTRSTHPYHVALQEGYRFWDTSVAGGAIEYDFMFVHHAGYAQSNTWQEMGEIMFADKMSVWNAPAGSLKNPYTGEPLADDVSGYDFSGLARLDKIMGILTEPGFDIVRDWPNFYLSDMDLLWKQEVSGITSHIMFGATFPTVPEGSAFEAALAADEAANLTAAYTAYQAANPGSDHTETSYRNYLYRYEFLEKYALEKKLIDVNGADVDENRTPEFKAFFAANTSELILQRVIAKVEEARQLSINSVDNPNNGWAGSRYGDDPWSSWYGALSIWSHSSGTTDAFAYKRTDYSCQGESNGLGTYSHEFGHIMDFPDNYNDPFASTPTRVPVGQWDLMGGGSFGGPGGAHSRWMLPTTYGASLPPNQVLRGKILNEITDPDTDVYHLTYDQLATQLGIAEVYARNIPTNLGVTDAEGNVINGYRGFRITDMTNQIPRGNAASNLLAGTDQYGFARIDPDKWNWGANSTFSIYSMEVVQQTGYDSFMADSGVLMALNHDDVMNRRTNSTFVVDANPGGLSFADYRHPVTGAFIPLPDGGEQQLAAALFHAGVHNEPEYYRDLGDATGKFDDGDTRTGVAGATVNEYVDAFNNLHFYILDKNYTPGKHGEILSYDLAVRRTDVDYATGGELILEAVRSPSPAAPGNFAVQTYSLTNTGATDIVRITLGGTLYNAAPEVATRDQNAALMNNLYAIGAGETIEFDVFIKETEDDDPFYDTSALLTITATSETTASKTTTVNGPTLNPGISLTASKTKLAQGDEIVISAAVSEKVKSNTAMLEFIYDDSLFEFVSVELANGVTPVYTEGSADGYRLVLMVQDYEMTDLVSITLKAKTNMTDALNKFIQLGAELVIVDSGGDKVSVITSTGLDYDPNEKDPDPDPDPELGTVTLIVLSDAIDAFGKTDTDSNWKNLKKYDLNKNGIIDIQDIAEIASKLY